MTYATKNADILALFTATGKDLPTADSDMGRAVQILTTICDSQSHSVPTVDHVLTDGEVDELVAESSDIFEALEEIEQHIGEDDFRLDFDGNEYRLINESDIWEVYKTELEQLIDDCYPEVKKSLEHSWIAIELDMEQTAKNAYADGYGHTFSGYDGSEEEAGGYYIFRTN